MDYLGVQKLSHLSRKVLRSGTFYTFEFHMHPITRAQLLSPSLVWYYQGAVVSLI